MEKQRIHGYRELTAEEIQLINEIKEAGERFHSLIEKLKGAPNTDLYWIDEAVFDLKKGLMSLTRSVARPTHF